MYGNWPSEHLVIANWDTEAFRAAPEGLPTLSQTLRDAGYWLGYVGQVAHAPGKGAARFRL